MEPSEDISMYKANACLCLEIKATVSGEIFASLSFIAFLTDAGMKPHCSPIRFATSLTKSFSSCR